jgi:hypothetical protein
MRTKAKDGRMWKQTFMEFKMRKLSSTLILPNEQKILHLKHKYPMGMIKRDKKKHL